ncbi:MAG TPA: ABC transporter ATP-binding protein [Alphaproteobacteria bacterium]|nr:ABC transporter ATP-binding protein [Alphaproteobacteria bacterium]
MLALEGVSLSFGGLRAVESASFTLAEGSIVALVGPNGAGKTTLFNLISGFLVPERGRILFEGRDITGMPPERIAALGLVRTFQIVQPFARLSVRENIAVGAHLRLAGRRQALAMADEIAERVGIAHQLDQPAGELTVAGRKRLELARALATAPRLLLLDEVMAGLNPRELDDIAAVVRAIRAGGVTLLLIEHVMRAVMSLAERVLVLNDGALIAEGRPAEIAADPRVITAYLGAGAAERMLKEGARA